MLATSLTPPEYQLVEVFPSGKVPRENSPYWRIPESVTDLQVTATEGGQPEITFTAREAGVDYVILRMVNQERRVVATLLGEPGEALSYVDGDASSSQSVQYSVLPRHRRLYEMGRLVTGEESPAVDFSPRRQWGWLFR